ncbi:MAG: hypothetical protein M1837_001054 [Sclerophora amabilis]|nr:MAG: hypothetical protein M1837_001054 [Sclerophora amabilis]
MLSKTARSWFAGIQNANAFDHSKEKIIWDQTIIALQDRQISRISVYYKTPPLPLSKYPEDFSVNDNTGPDLPEMIERKIMQGSISGEFEYVTDPNARATSTFLAGFTTSYGIMDRTKHVKKISLCPSISPLEGPIIIRKPNRKALDTGQVWKPAVRPAGPFKPHVKQKPPFVMENRFMRFRAAQNVLDWLEWLAEQNAFDQRREHTFEIGELRVGSLIGLARLHMYYMASGDKKNSPTNFSTGPLRDVPSCLACAVKGKIPESEMIYFTARSGPWRVGYKIYFVPFRHATSDETARPDPRVEGATMGHARTGDQKTEDVDMEDGNIEDGNQEDRKTEDRTTDNENMEDGDTGDRKTEDRRIRDSEMEHFNPDNVDLGDLKMPVREEGDLDLEDFEFDD